MYCGLKSAILTLVLGSCILALVAMVTDYWVIVPSEKLHIGLFRGCDEQQNCATVYFTDSSKYLLISASIIGFFTLPCGILEVRFALVGSLGCLSCIAVLSALMALLEFAGIINTVVNLRPLLPFHYSWSFAVGWIAMIMAIASVALSVYIRRKEKDIPSPEVQAEAENPQPTAVISPINQFLQKFQVKTST